MKSYYRAYLLQEIGNFPGRMTLQTISDQKSYAYDRQSVKDWLEEHTKRNSGDFVILEVCNQFPPIYSEVS